MISGGDTSWKNQILYIFTQKPLFKLCKVWNSETITVCEQNEWITYEIYGKNMQL